MSDYGKKTKTPPTQPGFYFVEMNGQLTVAEVEKTYHGDLTTWIVGSEEDYLVTAGPHRIEFWYPVPIQLPKE